MFDPRLQQAVDADDFGYCVPTIHYDSDAVPTSWFFLGVDFRGPLDRSDRLRPVVVQPAGTRGTRSIGHV